ncbi:MAG: methyltransferase domain-containing protein [Verrucomicrobia bacterium]|jgi:SAM-dependent methyltransferase|nr:methyltransferase domain-containing protein [Verrucomicrobiota bacterium]
MIIHRLIAHHLKHGDDTAFYEMQAKDAVSWMQSRHVAMNTKVQVLDLGCGHGVFGGELEKFDCQVSYADIECNLNTERASAPFTHINLDEDDYEELGRYDLIVCSNVFEHLAKPQHFLNNLPDLLNPGGRLYLSWTNWLSPWGGHDFSPFHFLGPHWGPAMFDKLIGKTRIHYPFKTLYPTYIGQTLGWIDRLKGLKVEACVPRYYNEFTFLTKLPVIREFLTWNTAMLIQRSK